MTLPHLAFEVQESEERKCDFDNGFRFNVTRGPWPHSPSNFFTVGLARSTNRKRIREYIVKLLYHSNES